MASLKGGMNVLVDALRTNVGSALHLGTPVETLRREASGWGLALGGAAPRELSVDAVVLATPPPVSSSLVSTVRPELSRLLGAIPGAPVVVVSLGFATDDIRRPMDGFGYLVPRCEDGPVLGVQWASSMFPDMRSPSGHNLLQVFLGGSRASGICSLSDVELVTLACRELRTVLGVRDAPIHARVFRHGWGLPQYEVGHTLRLEAMRDQVAELRGLELAGNAFDGVGIPSCVESAYEAARGISEYLAGKGNAIRRAGRSRMPP
jgi:oxygen-dependent protoporphyrinogen oxidase